MQARGYIRAAVSVSAFLASALAPVAVLAGYGVDALIGRYSGCSIGTLDQAIAAWGSTAQVAVLAGHWFTELMYILLFITWMIAVFMFVIGAHNERRYEAILSWIRYSTTGLLTLAVIVVAYSQSICLAA